jgi:AcrR family transcriptional regulator
MAPDNSSIWSRRETGRRGPRPEFSRDEITTAAIELADRQGLAAVSMRAVAGALGTAAGTLYRYVNSRDELLALMVDAALAGFPPAGSAPAGVGADDPVDGPVDGPAPVDGGWLDAMANLAHHQLALYRGHPWLLEAGLRVGSFGPRALDYFERCLLILSPLPNPVGEKLEAVGLVTGVVSLFARSGSAATTDGAGPTGSTGAGSPAAAFAAVDPAAHPLLVAALTTPSAPPRQDLFDRAVRSVLVGLLAPPVPAEHGRPLPVPRRRLDPLPRVDHGDVCR